MNSTLQIKTPRWSKPLLPPHRYKAAHGGRGSGKSHHFAERAIEEMIANPDIHIVCIREVQSSIKMSVKKLLEDKIDALGVGSYFIVQESQIKSKRGKGVIIFQGMQDHTAESIKSLEGFDICWCEEAQSLRQKSLDMLRPTIRKDGAEMWFSWNPRYPTDAVDAFLRSDDLEGLDVVVVEVNFEDNPWFPDALKAEMEYDRRRDPDKYAHVWMGKYEQNSEARVFHNWTVEEFESPPDALHRLGADWGFSNDPTTMVRCHIVGRKMYVDYEAYKIGCEIDHTPDLFMSSIPGCESLPCAADSARPETISYVRRHGFKNMFRATKGSGSLREGIEFLKSYDIVVHPRCKHLIDELSSYNWKIDPLTGLVTSVLEDKKNHLMDALRYANEKHRRLDVAQKTQNEPPQPTTHRWRHVN